MLFRSGEDGGRRSAGATAHGKGHHHEAAENGRAGRGSKHSARGDLLTAALLEVAGMPDDRLRLRLLERLGFALSESPQERRGGRNYL